jgi:hypothetical protein
MPEPPSRMARPPAHRSAAARSDGKASTSHRAAASLQTWSCAVQGRVPRNFSGRRGRELNSLLLFRHRNDGAVAAPDLVIGTIRVGEAAFAPQIDLSGASAAVQTRPKLIPEEVEDVLVMTAGTSPVDVIRAVFTLRGFQRLREPLIQGGL